MIISGFLDLSQNYYAVINNKPSLKIGINTLDNFSYNYQDWANEHEYEYDHSEIKHDGFDFTGDISYLNSIVKDSSSKIATIKLVKDSLVRNYYDRNIHRANKIEVISIEDAPEFFGKMEVSDIIEEFCQSYDPKILSIIKQTPEMCSKIMKRCPKYSFKYIQHQTPEICLMAVKANPLNIRFVKEQTEELCLDALDTAIEKKFKCLGDILSHIKDQTPEICKKAIEYDCESLSFVREQTREICEFALSRNVYSLNFIKDQPEDLCLAAVKANPETIKFIRNQTYAVCKEAVERNAENIQFVKDQTPDLCLFALEHRGMLKYIRNQTPEICEKAILLSRYAISDVKEQTFDLGMLHLKTHGTCKGIDWKIRFLIKEDPKYKDYIEDDSSESSD